MNEAEFPSLDDKLFAVRTALILLASALEDRFEPGVLRERLEFLIEEAEMRGADLRFKETSQLLTTMAKNLHTNFPKQTETHILEVIRDQA